MSQSLPYDEYEEDKKVENFEDKINTPDDSAIC